MLPLFLLLFLQTISESFRPPVPLFADLRPQAMGPASALIRRLALSDAQPGAIYGTIDGGKGSLTRSTREEGWIDLVEGPSGAVVVDPKSGAVYASGQSNVYRIDPQTRQVQNISPAPHDPSTKENLPYRFASQPPLAFSKHNDTTLYLGANVLLRSVNGGHSWEAISNELTRNDQKATAALGRLTCLAESPLNARIFWVGSDNGVLQVTENRASSWNSISPRLPGFMAGSPIRQIQVSPFEEATAYVIAEDKSQHPLWKTTDLGQTWKKIISGLPRNLTVNALAADPKRKGLLYLGTSHGLWVSFDDGEKWVSLDGEPDPVAINDLVIHHNALFAATAGRGIYQYGFLNVLREWSEPIRSKRAHLFQVPVATRWLQIPPQHGKHSRDSFANIYIYLKEPVKRALTIEIFNARGEKVLTKSVPQIGPGIVKFPWNLRHEAPSSIEEAMIGIGAPLQGPRVAPGRYSIRVNVDGESQEAKFEVVADPRHPGPTGIDLLERPVQRLTLPPRVLPAEEIAPERVVSWLSRQSPHDLLLEEFREQEAFCIRLRDAMTRVSQTVPQIRQLEKQLLAQQEVLAREPKATDLLQKSRQIHQTLGQLTRQMYRQKPKDTQADTLEPEFYSQFAALLYFADQCDSPPTQGMRKRAESLEKGLVGRMIEFKKVCEEDLPALNELARAKNMPIIGIPKANRK